MDQSASVISNAASALYITFYPSLKAFPIRLPPRSVFVCANSRVVSDKAVTAKWRYNLRVVETLVGARVLARTLGLQVADNEKITFREVLGRLVGERKGEELGVDELKNALERMVKEVEVLKPNGRMSDDDELGVTMKEMTGLSGLPEDVFREVYLSWVEGELSARLVLSNLLTNPPLVEATHFQLYKRAKHVYTEALRVLQFRQICLDTASSSQDSAANIKNLESLGRLMNESQVSCSQVFECSCPELDELTRLAKEAGAYGSRLTGLCRIPVPEYIFWTYIDWFFVQVLDGAATPYR
jgi:galactokinase